jgi:hypothetical protein
MSVQDFSDDVLQRIGAVIEPNLQPDESLADILAGTKFLARKRARLAGRSVVNHIDIEAVLSWFCCWPFKHPVPERPDERTLQIRRRAFAGAAEGNTEALEAAVPDTTLLLSPEAINYLQVRGTVDDLLRSPDQQI